MSGPATSDWRPAGVVDESFDDREETGQLPGPLHLSSGRGLHLQIHRGETAEGFGGTANPS